MEQEEEQDQGEEEEEEGKEKEKYSDDKPTSYKSRELDKQLNALSFDGLHLVHTCGLGGVGVFASMGKSHIPTFTQHSASSSVKTAKSSCVRNTSYSSRPRLMACGIFL